MIKDKMPIWQLILSNWHIIIALFTAIFMVSKAYDMNNNQTAQINDLQARVSALETYKNEDNTNWAVLKVQLSMIQNDINDIKQDLKDKKHAN